MKTHTLPNGVITSLPRPSHKEQLDKCRAVEAGPGEVVKEQLRDAAIWSLLCIRNGIYYPGHSEDTELEAAYRAVTKLWAIRLGKQYDAADIEAQLADVMKEETGYV
jgi:hypothetical protein